MKVTDYNIIDRTPNKKCPSCINKTIHSPYDWKMYHPRAREGFSREHGSPQSKENKDA